MGTDTNKEVIKDIPESIIISQSVLPYLRKLGFQHIQSDVEVSLGSRNLVADVVVYLGEGRETPYIVVEAKRKLPPDVSLLDAPVQQAYASAAVLGKTVRYLMVTDGEKYYWFERVEEGRSLIQLSSAPATLLDATPQPSGLQLTPVIEPQHFSMLMGSVMDILRDNVPVGLRMAVELNRIFIAKLFDEQQGQRNGKYLFKTSNNAYEDVTHTIRSLYHDAMRVWGWPTDADQSWFSSPDALLRVVELLQPYELMTVTPSVRGQFFWAAFQRLLSKRDEQHLTQPSLARLIVQLALPTAEDRVIDPACGSGLFLIESNNQIEAELAGSNYSADEIEKKKKAVHRNLFGIEQNPEVVELAATNLAINNISPAHIFKSNAINIHDVSEYGIELGTFDVVLLDPPVGGLIKSENILRQFQIVQQKDSAPVEVLFLELAVKLLKPGGRLVALLPDTMFSSPNRRYAREWLLKHTAINAIISLPPEALAVSGHTGKATILVAEKGIHRNQQRGSVLVADLDAVGYDRFGRPTEANDIPQLLDAYKNFINQKETDAEISLKEPRIWRSDIASLDPARLDVSYLDPESFKVNHSLRHALYPSVKLKQIARIVSGHDFKKYVEKTADGVPVVRAGSVRDLEIDISESPFVSHDEYLNTKRAQLQSGDVLVTTTGQYLGRAAVVEQQLLPAVASGAVSVVRLHSHDEVDPFFLAMVISSEIGKDQIKHKQASALAQPYIRRVDLSEILIPLPSINTQLELVNRCRQALNQARELARQAKALESDAKSLIITELLGESNNE